MGHLISVTISFHIWFGTFPLNVSLVVTLSSPQKVDRKVFLNRIGDSGRYHFSHLKLHTFWVHFGCGAVCGPALLLLLPVQSGEDRS